MMGMSVCLVTGSTPVCFTKQGKGFNLSVETLSLFNLLQLFSFLMVVSGGWGWDKRQGEDGAS